MSVGQFPHPDSYIVDDAIATLLSEKTDNIFIWCNTDQFVKRNQLSGFFSGMFISEIEEAIYYEFWNLEQKMIDESNNGFAEIVSRYIDQPMSILHKNVLQKYRLLAKANPIAQLNIEKLYQTEQNMYYGLWDESLYGFIQQL